MMRFNELQGRDASTYSDVIRPAAICDHDSRESERHLLAMRSRGIHRWWSVRIRIHLYKLIVSELEVNSE